MFQTYVLFGNPVQHSLSPCIHQLFAAQTQRQIHYSPQLVPRAGFTAALSIFTGDGANVTSPFKAEAYVQVKRHTARAAQAQAVNTIKRNPDNTFIGDNTDGIGFIRDISQNHFFEIKNKRILVLGAGGAARGLVPAILEQLPDHVFIANRDIQKTHQLVTAYALHAPISALRQPRSHFDLIINTTGVSLPNYYSRELTADYFYDLCYAPSPTDFLQLGRSLGAICINGLGMLVEQAAESFYFWQGVKPLTQPILQILRQKKES